MRHPISTAWISGSGRSGTTWLGRLLAAHRDSALLYEPLHPGLASFPEDLNPAITDAGDRPYIRAGSNNRSWTNYISSILSGRGFTRRTLFTGIPKHQRPRAIWRAFTGKRLVVKEIRSNLLIEWLTGEFGVRTIVIVRHPCAVVASQLVRNWGTKRNVLDPFLSQPDFVEDHLAGCLDYLNGENLDTVPKQLAARWAIENRAALEVARNNNRVLVVAYEQLVLDSHAELRKAFEFLGWPVDDRVWRTVERHLNPEALSRPHDWLGQWQSRLDPRLVDDILAVTRALGVTRYDERILPVASC